MIPISMAGMKEFGWEFNCNVSLPHMMEKVLQNDLLNTTDYTDPCYSYRFFLSKKKEVSYQALNKQVEQYFCF